MKERSGGGGDGQVAAASPCSSDRTAFHCWQSPRPAAGSAASQVPTAHPCRALCSQSQWRAPPHLAVPLSHLSHLPFERRLLREFCLEAALSCQLKHLASRHIGVFVF